MEQLKELKEDRFIVVFHQNVKKSQQKAWHDRYIKKNKSQRGGLTLMYENKFLRNLRKFQMHWLGPLSIDYITKVGAINMSKLNGEQLEELVNGS